MESTLNITYQILRGIDFLHRRRYVHTDLKPENIQFVNEHSDELKIIDFGSCEPYENDDKTREICTSQYRPPENVLILDCTVRNVSKNYDSLADVWSVGCMIFELLHGKLMIPVDEKDYSETDVNYFLKRRLDSKHYDDAIVEELLEFYGPQESIDSELFTLKKWLEESSKDRGSFYETSQSKAQLMVKKRRLWYIGMVLEFLFFCKQRNSSFNTIFQHHEHARVKREK